MTVKQVGQFAKRYSLRQSVGLPLRFRKDFQQILAHGRFYEQRLWILWEHPDAARDGKLAAIGFF